ncbi:MAG: cadherin-like beta sandwich domain-containing protein, partial [Cytophagaceae bacterium]
TVDGDVVARGAESKVLALTVGDNRFDIVVTPSDGSAAKTYTVNIIRSATSTNAKLEQLVVTDGAISPVFNSGQYSYTATVTGSGTAIIPTVADTGAVVTINGIPAVSGEQSLQTLNIGANTFDIKVTAEETAISQTYTLNITRLSNNAAAAFTLSANAKLAGVGTGPATRNYKTSVDANATSIMVKPKSDDPNATVTVNGRAVDRSTFSEPVQLTEQTTMINMESTAADGITKITYSIAVSRNGSNNADLDVALSTKSILYQTTGTAQVNYRTTVDAGTESLTVIPKSVDANATVTVNGVVVPRGRKSDLIDLPGATTIINVRITAQDGVSTRSYSIAVNKTGSNNARMDFAISGKPVLEPLSAGPAQENYSTTVAVGTSSITITPKFEDANATVIIDGQP